ncbi:hypothetical protein COCSUDRAFT_32506 [Coccomyxa subellipsoidea C-169]|uniref:Uncharacterized protein n=1 Tax=Coccomyxa subellipsoidea (strain C-169) TaxID=574566 RepID=I0Z6A1_COCSC|nr:hypothetical protein COCSUDRAFT_32506 [Coccomyxa subellipsoidea C-169]EIE26170.1 hypothetical protein COCSUDRAFT_32506 [Coccomyxa subellipsoidea C-169]|eukprot:XP_005650714.1 hypothetical protein COCSUDRAFT_32506 [Coccomyxa subellipsoidea C-169]
MMYPMPIIKSIIRKCDTLPQQCMIMHWTYNALSVHEYEPARNTHLNLKLLIVISPDY